MHNLVFTPIQQQLEKYFESRQKRFVLIPHSGVNIHTQKILFLLKPNGTYLTFLKKKLKIFF